MMKHGMKRNLIPIALLALASAAHAESAQTFPGMLEARVAAASPAWKLVDRTPGTTRVQHTYASGTNTVTVESYFFEKPADAADALAHFKKRFGRTAASVQGLGDETACWVESGENCLIAGCSANVFFQVGAPSYDMAFTFATIIAAVAAGQ
jgi:hypothetical protein